MIKIHPDLLTVNYILRTLKKSELKFFLSLYQNTRLMAYIGEFSDESFLTDSFYRSVRYNQNRIPKRLTYCIYEGDRAIGLSSLMWSELSGTTCEIGMIINECSLNRGVAEEAMSKLIEYAFYHSGVKRVFARFLTENIPALKLVNKLGFTVRKSSRNEQYCFLDKPGFKQEACCESI